MPTEAYQVVLSGELAEGATIENVRLRMAALFKTAESKIDALLKHHNPVVKRNLDMQTAGKYQRAIEKAGALCRVEPMAAAPKQVAEAAAPAPKVCEPCASAPAAPATGPRVVPVQMLYRGEERFCPQDLEKVNGFPGGFNFNLPDLSEVPFARISAISAFTVVEGGKDCVKLLLFVNNHERPYISPLAGIAFGDFPVQPLANPMATFRNFLHFLCRQNPAMILEETTFDFLSGSPLPRLDGIQIQKLATAIGKLIESGDPE